MTIFSNFQRGHHSAYRWFTCLLNLPLVLNFFPFPLFYFFLYLIKCLEIYGWRYFISLLLFIKCILLLYISLTLLRRTERMKCLVVFWLFLLLNLLIIKRRWKLKENLIWQNSPKLSGIPEGPGSRPGIFWRPRKELAKEEVLEWSIEPFKPSIGTSPASEATVSLLFESSPVLWAWSDCKSECCGENNVKFNKLPPNGKILRFLPVKGLWV